jgi:hypothetical protein
MARQTKNLHTKFVKTAASDRTSRRNISPPERYGFPGNTKASGQNRPKLLQKKTTTPKQISKVKNPSSPKPSPYSTSSMLSTEYINDHLPERTDRDLKYDLDVNPRTGATPSWSHRFSGSKLNDIKGTWGAWTKRYKLEASGYPKGKVGAAYKGKDKQVVARIWWVRFREVWSKCGGDQVANEVGDFYPPGSLSS